ncbi:MAG: hypothetical protein JNL32_02155, partial [Candidatus Kapabacteria bacterium]|nr:hypothetical protein [Candidatus Kapabacteria bacterium]
MNYILSLCIVALCNVVAFAQIPATINYQGVLALNATTVVPDSTYIVSFRLYASQASANAVWSEQRVVTTQQGVFDVILGELNPFAVPFDRPYWLGVTVEGQSEMQPRIPLVSVPYALQAVKAVYADSARYSTTAGRSDTANIAIRSIISDTALIANEISGDAKGVVISVNGLQGNIILEGTGGTTVSTSGSRIRISSTGGNGIATITSNDGSISVVIGPAGADLSIANNAITTEKIRNASVTLEKLAPGVIPSSLPPSGNAGGDLSGTYPNPIVRNNAITTSKLADKSVTSAKLDDITTAGTYGNSGTVPQITVDAQGRITSVQNIPISATNLTTAGGDLSGTYPNPSLAQKGATSGQVLKWNGTAWLPANDDGQVYTAGAGISISGATITNTGDTDASNDITTTTQAGGDVSGTFNALKVDRIQNRNVSSDAPVNGQVLQFNSTTNQWEPTTITTGANGVAGGDLTGTYPNPTIAQKGATTGQVLAWSGTGWSPITPSTSGTAGGDLTGTYPNPTLAQKGATSGQVLKWNGTAWAPSADNGDSYTAGDAINITAGAIGVNNAGITTAKLADANVTTAKLADASVTSAKLNQMSATSGQVLKWNGTSWTPSADNGDSYTAGDAINITAGAIGVNNSGITTAKLADANVTTAKLADANVTTAKLADASVTSSKLNQMSATSGQVLKWNGTAWAPSADNGDSYTAGDAINITAGAIGVNNAGITTTKLADASVTSAKLNQMSATSGQVLKWNGTSWTPSADNGDSYTAGDAINITAGAIGVNNAGITTAKLADANVTTAKLADASVTSAKLNQMSATSGQVLKWNGTTWTPSADNGDSYTAGDAINITAGAIGVNNAGITTAKLADANVTTAKLADANVTTAKLADASVTSAKLNQMSATSGQVLKWNGTAWTPSADNGDSYTAGDAINITAGAIGVNNAGITTAKLADA